MYHGDEVFPARRRLLADPRCHTGAPSIPDPNKAAIQGVQTQAQLYPFQYLINALSQMGGSATLTDPVTGQPTSYDFTGLGTADVQNQMSDQMAQTLLDIQQGLGPQYIAQRLQDLQQADPTGYAARKQLFDRIMAEAGQSAPNLPLSQDTQAAILGELQKGTGLSPEEIMQVQQGTRGGQVASGIYLGNAPAQAEADAVVQAGDQMQAQRQGAAGQFLSSGVSPSDITFRKIQQDMADLGAFISGTTPTAQFSSLSGAQSTAAPYPDTGYSPYSLNEGQGVQQGISNAFGLYSENANWAQNNINPYLAGLSATTGLVGTAANLGWNPWSTSTPSSSQMAYLNAGYGPVSSTFNPGTSSTWSMPDLGNTYASMFGG